MWQQELTPDGIPKNDTAYQLANPDNATQEGMEQAMRNYNALSVAFIEPEEVAQIPTS